jgi:AraC family carnitine catabolism transcriptional activator
MPLVDIVLTDNFPILSLSLITEPMRVANRESQTNVWRWRLMSVDGGSKISSSGIAIDTQALASDRSDIVLLLCSYQPESSLAAPLLNWLKRKAQYDCVMGCVDTGALIFAKAGLLTHSPAAVHFEALSGFRENHAHEMFVDQLFNVQEKRCSSAGGVATFDMTLGLIARYMDKDMVARVAEILTYRPIEHSGPQQKLLADTALKRLDRRLGKAVDLMINTLDQPLNMTVIANQVNTPKWTLARLFKRYLQSTPTEYYRRLRLQEARNLLRNSNLRIGLIGSLCGFDNPESFARAYKRHFGITASNDRD